MLKNLLQKITEKCKSHLDIGKAGEDAAVAELTAKGYRILDRNWRCKTGELDIIATYQKVLVIIEVKTRQVEVSKNFSPLEAIDSKKILKIKKVTDFYLQANHQRLKRYLIRSIRFDVVAAYYEINSLSNEIDIKVEHVLDAFNY